MGMIYKSMKVQGPKGERVVKALMDTGASSSFGRRELMLEVTDPVPLVRRISVAFGQGGTEIEEAIVCLIEIEGYQAPWMIFLIPGLSEELILGADFFQRYKIKLDPEREDLMLDPTAFRLQLI